MLKTISNFGTALLKIENGNPTLSTVPNEQNLDCNLSNFKSLCESKFNHQLQMWYVGSKRQAIMNSNPTLKQAFDINK